MNTKFGIYNLSHVPLGTTNLRSTRNHDCENSVPINFHWKAKSTGYCWELISHYDRVTPVPVRIGCGSCMRGFEQFRFSGSDGSSLERLFSRFKKGTVPDCFNRKWRLRFRCRFLKNASDGCGSSCGCWTNGSGFRFWFGSWSSSLMCVGQQCHWNARFVEVKVWAWTSLPRSRTHGTRKGPKRDNRDSLVHNVVLQGKSVCRVSLQQKLLELCSHKRFQPNATIQSGSPHNP